MLLVHGMLHLLGYDHIEDDDYDLMVTKEDAVLEELGLMPKEEETDFKYILIIHNLRTCSKTR